MEELGLHHPEREDEGRGRDQRQEQLSYPSQPHHTNRLILAGEQDQGSASPLKHLG